jgi:hypothetical protein
MTLIRKLGTPSVKIISPKSIQIKLLKINEVAAKMRVTPVNIRRRVANGSLPFIRISTRLYFNETDIDTFITTKMENSPTDDVGTP